MFIPVKDLQNQAPMLAQSIQTAIIGEDLSLSANMAPQIFTRTYMASLTSDFMFEVGLGKMDPLEHTRLLVEYARDSGRELSEVAEEYFNLLASAGYSQELFRQVIASIVGASDRPLATNRIPQITPTYVINVIEKHLESDHTEIFKYLLADFVCHMFAPLGWIQTDAPYIYRVRRSNMFPGFKDLVDMNVAKDMIRVTQHLASADLSLVKSIMDRKSAVIPGMIAQHLANAVVTAYEISRGSYDAESIVRSVLTVMTRLWSSDTPQALYPSERIQRSQYITDLRGNLAIFMAAQEMAASGVELENVYSDEEFVSVVLPAFSDALSEVGIYKLRLLSDSVMFLGKKSSYDHQHAPGHVVIYENWDYSSEVAPFVPVKQTTKGSQRFLVEQTAVASALESAMKPIHQVLDVESLVDSRLGTYDMVNSSNRMPSNGTTLVMGIPSLLQREDSLGLPSVDFSGEEFSSEGLEPTDLQVNLYNDMVYDYRALLTHLAVARAESVSVATHMRGNGSEVPFLTWRIRTNLVKPLGQSAIMHGEVLTSEPLEALVYVDDFAPSEALRSQEVVLADYRHAVHIWDWRSNSVVLNLAPVYRTEIRNNVYTAMIDEHEMLGLGVRRRNVRFLKPTVAASVARMWVNWMKDDAVFIDNQIAQAKDDLIRESFRGRRIQSALQLVGVLSRIGTAGVGARATSLITQRIAADMYGKDRLDDYAEIHVGVQRHRLNVWAGLSALQLLGLITLSEASEIIERLVAVDAMALVVGTVELN